MLDQGNRTFIGSVVFVDIIGYSRKSVSEQILIKDRFTNLLSESLSDISPEQRLILDTGDGAALSFLGDPEDALFVSMNLRDLVSRTATAATTGSSPDGDTAESGQVELPLRIGINLGPVKLARDINGHPNIVGDGINVAQRIMSFAQVGQIVVSRSFFDVVSVISEEYAKLFRYEGSRTDKHVREHEIYVVGESEKAFNKARAGMVDRASTTNSNLNALARGSATGAHGVGAGGALPLLQDQRKLLMAGGALGLIVLVLVAALMSKKPAEVPAPALPAAKTELPATPTNPSADPVNTQAAATAPPTGVAPELAKAADAAAGNSTASSTGSAAPAAPAPTAAHPANTDAKVGKPESTKSDPAKVTLILGTILLNIDPWGEIFVNGKSIGTSPPVKQHKLAPGKYKIEVKNTSFTPFVATVEVKAKEDLRIKHKFQ